MKRDFEVLMKEAYYKDHERGHEFDIYVKLLKVENTSVGGINNGESVNFTC
jgi:hypothetical protein